MLIQDARYITALDWDKTEGLIPVVVQHAFDGRVLMQAFMITFLFAPTIINF